MNTALTYALLLSTLGFTQSPKSFPTFEFPDFNNKLHSSKAFKGHPVLLDFWATWCISCRQTIPILSKIQNEYQDQGLKVIGISIDIKKNRQTKAFLKKFDMNYLTLWDKGNSLADSLKFQSIPALFLFN